MKNRIIKVLGLFLVIGVIVGATVLSTPQDLAVSTTVEFVGQTRTVGSPIIRNETEFTTISTPITVENRYEAVTVIRPAIVTGE